MLPSGIQTKINTYHLKNQGAGARGQRGRQGLVGILTLSCGGGEGLSPVCDLVPAGTQTPEGHSDSVGRRQLLLFQCLSVFCTHLGCEQLHWLQSRARDVCGSAPGSEPKTCLFQDELPGSEVTKSPLQVLSHTHPLQIQANIPKLGRAFLPLKSKGLLWMQRGFLLLFPSHSITAGHRQMEAAFYMQIFGTH